MVNKMKQSSLLKIFISLYVLCVSIVSAKDITLYRPEDSVLVLTKENICEHLHNQSKPVIVVFYVSWCSHCQRFAPIFAAIAKEYRFHNISFAAINCANEATQEVCSIFGVDRFPTIKTVRSSVPVSIDNPTNVVDYIGSKSLNGLRKLARELIVNSQSNNSVYEVNELTDEILQRFYAKNGDGVLFIVFGDDSDGIISSKLVMDTSLCSKFSVYKVSDPKSSFYNKFNIRKSPLIIAVRYSTNYTLISPNDPTNTAKVRRDIYRHFSFMCPDAAALFSISMMDDDLGKKLKNFSLDLKNIDIVGEISFEDLNGAISYSLRHEIGAKTLGDDLLKVASDWILLVSKCIPWSKEEREQLDGITSLLNITNKPISLSEFSSIVNTPKMKEVFPVEPKWKNCLGSTEFYRGFPCSMWVLFHTMLTTCENKKPHIPFDAISVLLNIRKYIDSFFTCSYCRNHFLFMTQNVTNEVTTNEEAILYLWNRHNTVNSRLRYDESADPEHPKIQFPHISSCSRCHNVSNLKPNEIFISKPGFGTPNIEWNRREILNFLRHYYSPENIRLSRSIPSSPIDVEQFNVDDDYASKFNFIRML